MCSTFYKALYTICSFGKHSHIQLTIQSDLTFLSFFVEIKWARCGISALTRSIRTLYTFSPWYITFQMRSLLTYVIFIYYEGSSIFFAAASLTDLSLLSGGYNVDEYLDTHQYQDSPWIVSRFPYADNDGGHFLPIINVEYPITEITPHLGYINHMTIKNQLGNTFIPSVGDETLNTLLNSESYHTSIASSNGLFLPNSDHEIEDLPQHFGPIPMHKIYCKLLEYFCIHSFFLIFLVLIKNHCFCCSTSSDNFKRLTAFNHVARFTRSRLSGEYSNCKTDNHQGSCGSIP